MITKKIKVIFSLSTYIQVFLLRKENTLAISTKTLFTFKPYNEQ